jgi:hypothetical protein
MLETFTDIDSLNAVELLTVHNDLTANFDEMVDNTHLPKPYEPLLKDISQADDHLDKAASAILTRLLPEQTIEDEKLHIRRGAFAILQNLQAESSDTSMSDIVTLRQILKQRRVLHAQIPTLIEEFEE